MPATFDDLVRLNQDMVKLLTNIEKHSVAAAGGGGAAAGGLGTSGNPAARGFSQALSKGKIGELTKTLTGGRADLSGIGKRLGGGGGGALGGAGGALMMTYKAVKALVTDIPDKLRAHGREVLQQNFQFQSPGMKNVEVTNQIANRMRSFRMGEQLAGSAAGLANSQERLNNAMEPIDVARQQSTNNWAKLGNDAMAHVLEQSGYAKQGASITSIFGKDLPEFLGGLLGIKPSEEKVDNTEWLEKFERAAARDEHKKRTPIRPDAPRVTMEKVHGER